MSLLLLLTENENGISFVTIILIPDSESRPHMVYWEYQLLGVGVYIYARIASLSGTHRWQE